MPSAFGLPVRSSDRFGVANGFKYITTLTASVSASLSYTAFDSTTYESYCIVLEDIKPVTAGVELHVHGSINAGSSYDSLWYYRTAADGTATATSTASNAASVGLIGNIRDTLLLGGAGVFYLIYGTLANTKSVYFGTAMCRDETAGTMNFQRSAAYYDSALPINALKWQASSGNLTRGTIHIYGLQKA